MSAGLNVFVNIGAKIGAGFNSSVSQVERRFDGLARHVKLRTAEMRAHMHGLQNSFNRFSTSVSMPAGFAVGAGMRFAYEWSKVGNELQAVTGMSMKARREVEKVARSLPGNPTENLKGALDIARTGYDDPAQLAALLPTTIKLGRADGSVDTAQAADIMTNVMKGMKMPDGTYDETVASAKRVANNIAFASAKSSTDVRLMGESFKYAAPLAARLKVPIEHLSAYFMTMADAGIKGSESGVALRSGMVRLLKPTKAAMGVLAKYNMNLADYTGGETVTGASLAKQLNANGFKANAKQLDGILASGLEGEALMQRITETVAEGINGGAGAADLDKVATAVNDAMFAGADKMNFTKFLQDVTKKGWKAKDIVTFFDVRQGARLDTLTGEDLAKNIERVEAAMRAANGQGDFLDSMYLMQMQGAVGPWERMKQAVGNLVIAMAESGAMDTIADALDRISKGVMWLSESNPALLRFGTYMLIALAAAAPLGFALSGLAATGSLLLGVFRPVGWVLKWLAGRFMPLRWAMVAARYGVWALVKDLGGPLLKGFSRLGPLLMRGLTAVGPWLLRGLAMAFGLLSNPVGWAILAVSAIAIVYSYWDEIVAAFNTVEWGRLVNSIAYWLGFAWGRLTSWWKSAWAAIGSLVFDTDWGAVATKVLDAILFGFGFAWTKLTEWWKTAWQGIIDYVTTIDWGAIATKIGNFFSSAFKKALNPSEWGIWGIFNGAGASFSAGAAAGAKPRALGGSVSAGSTYEWHERGREMFVPGRSGTVIPAHVVAAMNRGGGRGGGGVTVGQIVIQGANDPHATAMAVRSELKRLASGQSALLSD